MAKLTPEEPRLSLFLWRSLVSPSGFVGMAYVGTRIEATEIGFVGSRLTQLHLTPPRALFGLPSPGETFEILPVGPRGYALVVHFHSVVAVNLTLLFGGWWARRKARRPDAEFS